MDEQSIDELIREAIGRMPWYSYSMDGSMCFNVNDPKRTLYRRVLTEAGETWVEVPQHTSAPVQQQENT